MKKLTEWLHLTERTKLIVNVAAAAALLLAAMLVPLAFRTEEPAVETTDAPRRAEIFQRYLAGDDSVAVERIETPEAELTAACETRMHTLAARCIDDREAELGGPYSSEYTVLTDGETTLRIARMWLEQRGDWQNWLDVFFDADTGTVYRLYLSRERLSHAERYPATEESRPTVEYTAEMLAAELGGTVRSLRETGSNRAFVTIGAAQGSAFYDIACVCYDNLIDLTIDCL